MFMEKEYLMLIILFPTRILIVFYILFFQQLIMLSASANKLSKLKERAAEYASLIMEELDPDDLGYIEVIISCSSEY